MRPALSFDNFRFPARDPFSQRPVLIFVNSSGRPIRESSRAMVSVTSLASSTALPATLPVSTLAIGNRQADHVASAVEAALSAVEPFHRTVERRREMRRPYPYPIHLTPLGPNACPDVER